MALSRARIAAAMSWRLFGFGMEGHKAFDEFHGGLAYTRGCFEHFFVRQRPSRPACGEVGDARKAGDAQSTLPGDNGFRHGAHADDVGAQAGEGANFGGRLVAWPAHCEVDAGMESGAGLAGSGSEQTTKRGRVSFREVDEALEAWGRRSAEGIRAHQVDVVAQAHEIAGAEAFVDSARGVG